MHLKNIRTFYSNTGIKTKVFMDDILKLLYPIIFNENIKSAENLEINLLLPNQEIPNNKIILVSMENFRNLIKDENKDKLFKILSINKIILCCITDTQNQYRIFVEENPWIKDLNNLYRITDCPYLNDSKSIYFDSTFISMFDLAGTVLLKNNNLNNSFFCLMNKSRTHRIKIVESMYEKKLLEDNYVVFHKLPSSAGLDNPPSNLIFYDEKIRPLLKNQKIFTDLQSFSYQWEEGNWKDNKISHYYNDYCLEVVAETLTDFIFVTEKTVRPLVAGMPFVLIGAQYFLKHLREIGFKTYSDFWDESYDDDPILENRIDKALSIVANLQEKNMLPDIYKKSRHIAEHNLKRLLHFSGELKYVNSRKIKNFIEKL